MIRTVLALGATASVAYLLGKRVAETEEDHPIQSPVMLGDEVWIQAGGYPASLFRLTKVSRSLSEGTIATFEGGDRLLRHRAEERA